VPNEIVEIGILASDGLVRAVNDPRGSFSPSGPGSVCLPSLISTIRAGGRSFGGAGQPLGEALDGLQRREDRLTVAVDSDTLEAVDRVLDRFPSAVGTPARPPCPANRDQPEVDPRGEPVGELLRRPAAACSRVGDTSVAHADSDHVRSPA